MSESRSESFDLDSAYQGEEGWKSRHGSQGSPSRDPTRSRSSTCGCHLGETASTRSEKMWELDLNLQIVICISTTSGLELAGHLSAVRSNGRGLLILKKPFDLEEVCQLAHALTGKWRLPGRHS